MEYNFEADLHTHTIASGHAYNTIREMARAAADKGLKALDCFKRNVWDPAFSWK